jgi:hypothetical protein
MEPVSHLCLITASVSPVSHLCLITISQSSKVSTGSGSVRLAEIQP